MYIPQTSRIRVFVPIKPPRGRTVDDLVRFPGELAFVEDAEGNEPADTDYHPAVWIGRSLTLVVGRDAPVTYPPGDYMVYGRIDAGDERPVLRSGRVRVGGPGYPPP